MLYLACNEFQTCLVVDDFAEATEKTCMDAILVNSAVNSLYEALLKVGDVYTYIVF